MPISFCLKKTKKFINYNIQAIEQTQLIDEASNLGLAEGHGSTSMIYTKEETITHHHLKCYSVNHDLKIKTQGKVFDNFFNFYFVPKEFTLFFEEEFNLTIIRAPKKVSSDFITYLQDKQNCSFDNISVDFKKVTSKIESIKGLWVKVDKQGVNNEAYFGPSVENDPEVIEGIKSGKVSYAVIRFPYKNNFELVGISKFGNIVLYNHGLTDSEELELIYYVYHKIIN